MNHEWSAILDLPGMKSSRAKNCHLESQEVVGHLRRAGHFGRPVETEDEKVHDETEVLNDEGGKLEAANDAVRVGVVHVLIVNDYVILGRHVIGDVVVDDKTEQSGAIFINLFLFFVNEAAAK